METQIDFAEPAARARLHTDDERTVELIKASAAECIAVCRQAQTMGAAAGVPAAHARAIGDVLATRIATLFACDPLSMLGRDGDDWYTRTAALMLARDPRLAVDDCDDVIACKWQVGLRTRLQELDSRLSTADCEGIGKQLLNSVDVDPHRVADEWFATYGETPAG